MRWRRPVFPPCLCGKVTLFDVEMERDERPTCGARAVFLVITSHPGPVSFHSYTVSLSLSLALFFLLFISSPLFLRTTSFSPASAYFDPHTCKIAGL